MWGVVLAEERFGTECGDCDERAGERVGREDAGCEDAGCDDADWVGVVPARAAALVAGVAALVAGADADGADDADVPYNGAQAARAGAQASTRMAAGRAKRMGRDVSKSRVQEWHLHRYVRTGRPFGLAGPFYAVHPGL